MSISKGFSSITINDIYSNITEYDLYNHYFGVTNIPSTIKSPLAEDKNPSCSIYSRNGRIYYYDRNTNSRGGIMDLLSEYWRISYRDTIKRVYNELVNIKKKTPTNLTYGNREKVSRITYSDSVNLDVKVREWKEYDLIYWEKYGINKDWLIFSEIYPISHTIITKNGVKSTFVSDKYAYVFVERKDKKVSLKVYQPFNTRFKWTNKSDSSVFDLWTKLPEKGEELIICSSKKDALSVWSNTGIPCTSLQGEGYIPKEHVIAELKSRFKNVYILYDNDYGKKDNAGRKYGNNLSKKFSLIQLEIPAYYQAKDPSDFCYQYGREPLRNLILLLINQRKKYKFLK